MRMLAALLMLVVLGAARDPILVPEISQHEIQVQQGFTGTDLPICTWCKVSSN